MPTHRRRAAHVRFNTEHYAATTPPTCHQHWLREKNTTTTAGTPTQNTWTSTPCLHTYVCIAAACRHVVDLIVVDQRHERRGPVARASAVIYFGWVFFLVSSGSPHVRRTPMGVRRTCREPDEIELTPMGVKLNGSGGAPLTSTTTSVPTKLAAVHTMSNKSPSVPLTPWKGMVRAPRPSSYVTVSEYVVFFDT